jgi:hypothetical protein
MTFDVTYTIESGPPPQSFDAYASAAVDQYRRLLDVADDERVLQDFIEQNPCFAPTVSPKGSEYPVFGTLISQPVLTGLRSKKPDFLVVPWNSSYWYPTFIEIESPSKALFRADGIPTAQFTEARNQLAQWRAWLSDPTNQQKFISDYAIPEHHLRFRTMEPRFVLVYGRRSEFADNAELSKQRAALMSGADETLMSFDRLTPNPHLSRTVAARALGFGRYRALGVMPTMTLGPTSTDDYLNFDGIDEVLAADKRISPERREFLRRRLPYWRNWMKGQRGIIKSTDYE